VLKPDNDIEILPEQARWLKVLWNQVPPTTLKKGREYAEGRRVSDLTAEGNVIRARVLGGSGEQYSVEIQRTQNSVETRCNCLAWGKYGPHCKHVIAAAVAYLQRLGTPDDKVQDASPGNVLALPALAKLEGWLGLSALADYEFLYRLTQAVSGMANRHWIIDVRRQDAAGKGPIQIKRVLASGSRISPADERVFSELSRHEMRYDARVVLSDEDLCDLVDLLRSRRVIYRGTLLLFASEPARPQIHLESRPDAAVARIEFSLPDGATAELKDVILLPGKQTYLFAGQTLYPVDPGLPGRLLRKWRLEPSMVFPASQVNRVLTFFAAHLPRFRMNLKADGVKVEDAVEPKFILTVEGAQDKVKAHLGARYGQTTVQVSPTAVNLGYASATGVNGEPALLYRRSDEAERFAGKLLLEKGFRFDPQTGAYEMSGDRAIDFWAREYQALPKEWEQYAAERPKVRVRARLKPRIRVGTSGMNWFELDADFATEEQSLDLGAVRMWLSSGRRYVPLTDGTFAEADRAELTKVADLLEEAGALPGKKRTRLPLFQAPSLEMLGAFEGAQVEAKARKAIRELQDISSIPAIAPPADLTATLRHYQLDGLSWLWFLHRHGLSGILADDMGLGKTIQALALLQKAKDEDGRKPSLVVAPTSVLANWEREVERFAPKLSTVVWHGQERRERADQLKDVDLALTSYALVRRDVAELSEVQWRYVILDEAQFIKNADSVTAQACKALPSEARLALTGTPLENRLSELWSIFDFAMPGFLGTADHFSDRYEEPIQVQNDAEVRERLRRKIRPFIMRRLKSEVAKDLPPKTESIAYCEFDDAQAALYRQVLEESRRKIYESIDKRGFARSRISIFAALMRLRQVCCDPRLLKLPQSAPLPRSAKLERFGELVEDIVAEGHRALVFSQFTQMLELLTRHADEHQLKYGYLDGRTRDRMARVDSFNDPSGPPLFFISLKAGGTGLNLTAADYVIHYDPWWNPAVEEQATDRTHRIGQTKAIISYKLIVRGTVEEKILALQKRKKDLAEGVLGADAGFGKALTEKDVEELLSPDL
jgi:superfamily II DNA or RNA helicase